MKKLILALMLVATPVMATPPWLQPPVTTNVTEQYYSESQYENNFNDKEVSDAIAAVGAFSMIPTTNHRNKGHGHTGIGVGVTSYNDSIGYALALEGQIADAFNVKAGISGAGNEEIYGVGGSWAFGNNN